MQKNMLRKKLFFSIYTFLVIVFILISILSYFLIFEELKNREIKNLLSSTSSTKKNIEMVLKMVENFDEVIYENKLVLNILSNEYHSVSTDEKEKIRSFLNRFTLMNNFIQGIHIIGKNNTFFSSNIALEKNMLESSLKNFDVNKKTNKISANYYKPFSSSELISYNLPLYNFKTKEKLGIILVDIKIDYFTELLISSIMESEEKVFITDADNNILFNYPGNIDFNYILDNNLLEAKKYLNKNSLISSERIKYSSWKYVRIIPIDKTIVTFSNIFRIMLFLVFLIVVISSLYTLRVSTKFSRPIIELNKKFKEMEKGNLDLVVNFDTKDEIGEMGKSFNKMVKELDSLIKNKFEDQKRKDEMKFQILQAQINPHFLYNTLDSIRWMALIENMNNIGNMVSATIDLLKYNISSENDIVTINMEIESIKNYLIIQKYRYGNIFDASYELDESLLNEKVVRFSLQPIIENSFFHAFNLEKNKGEFKIKLFRHESKVFLEIWDNGRGVDKTNKNKDTSKMHTGIGLKNIDERIKIYFGNDFGVGLVSKQGKGTTVTITLPYVKEENT